MTPLQDPRPGDCDVLETSGTFRNRRLSCIQWLYEASAKLGDLREGMRLAALVHDTQRRSFLNAHHVRFEVPPWVRSSSGCLSKEVIKRGGVSQRCKCNVLA